MGQFVPTDVNDLTKVDASPTKAFFVDIITKDIQLDEAIQDLVDNCVDGAKRLRPGDNPNFTDLFVAIEISPDRFSIRDNCGGIPLDIARRYAFKFGRAAGFAPTTRSVGQFGIGMKRALFKMGEHFTVRSKEPDWEYEIDVDIQSWTEDDINWDFDIRNLIPGPHAVADTGTELEVTPLQTPVADTFRQGIFLADLRQDIRIRQQQPMRWGLQITLNGEAIIPSDVQLKQGDVVKPAFRRYTDDLGGTAPLVTRLYAGVADSSRAHAGWYIFCNGRCVLEADQSKATGWSDVSDAGVGMPKYHGQFARFRGYAFLDSDDASILPWNTTKTGLDPETDAYRRLRGRLIEIARPVIDFLNALDAESDFEDPDKILTQGLARTPSIALERLPSRDVFIYQTPPPRGPAMGSINYKKPRAEIEALRDRLQVPSLRAVGERSFEFTYQNLVSED
jgi:hypothetical protein